MERYEGLKRLTSHESYTDAKKRLEDYLKQYKWITETDSPYEDIKESLFRCAEKRKGYEDGKANEKAEEQTKESAEEGLGRKEILENENQILALKIQYEALKSDTYVENLRRNITALYLSIDEFEARIDRTDLSTKKPKEILAFYGDRSRRKFRFMFASLTGLIPGEVNMNLENNKEIPNYIIENYDLVNVHEITEEQKEQALVVVHKPDYSLNLMNRLIGVPVEQFIAAHGIKERKEKVDNDEKPVVAEVTNEGDSNKQNSVNHNKGPKHQNEHAHDTEEKQR